MPQAWLAECFTALCWVVGGSIALSGLDDLAVDLMAHGRALRRRITIYRRHPRATSATIPRPAERPVAILVPAWRESTVIAPMLARLRRTLAYRRYRVFVGTYANDPETARAARAVDPSGDWLTIERLDRRGPTSKADCLNSLWHVARHEGRASGNDYAIFVLHDAEDVVHPDELRLFNFLAGRADMVQLPVQPLAPPIRDLVAGHYLDEFAESHQKDLVLREGLAGGVPSAGVGCAFTRTALEDAAQANGGFPFASDNLTEDYALALTLLRRRRRTIFVRLPETGSAPLRNCAVVATHGCFPSEFGAAVRQKARWLTGIVLQTWQTQGWPGPAGVNYMLFRDRKAIVSAILAAATYPIAALLIADQISVLAGMRVTPALLSPQSPLLYLLGFNLLLFVNRILHRVSFVWRLAGPAQALMSIARIPVANAINCAAALRALMLYSRHRINGRPLLWDKTAHVFPRSDTP